MKALRTVLIIIAIVGLASCEREALVDNSLNENAGKVSLSLSASGEAEEKAYLDFSQTQNVRWSNTDLIAVFDGTVKNEFSIDSGTNTGATATFSGEVTAGYSNLYAVYPYSAANSLSGSSLSVTVPSFQTVSSTAKVDPAALVSVGLVSSKTIEFKQVCGLLKFEINSANVAQVVLRGTNLAGTATVAATGVVSGVTSGENSIVLSYAGGNFATGTYYAAVLPGTTAAEVFTVSFVESTGLAHTKTASGAVTVARKQGRAIGALDDSYTDCRHITNKSQLFAWGAAMVDDEQEMPVYLDADINCGGDTWSYSGTEFNGRFFGQNHKIYNLVIENTANTGFIYTLDGTMQDVVFGSSNGTSWDGTSRITHKGTSSAIEYVGLICRLTGYGSMDNVVNFAKVEVPSSSNSRAYVGGLIGVIPDSAAGITVNNCKNFGTVSNASSWSDSETRMGGILGQCSGVLTASGIENHGALTVSNSVTNFVGGLCGDLASGSSVTASKNYGSITFTDNGTQLTYLGGCFGSVRGNPATTISDCHNYGSIIATRNAQHRFGGILGFFQSGTVTVTDCVNHTGANLTVASSVAARTVLGGIGGACLNGSSSAMSVTIQDCKNEAAVTNDGASSEIGGISGMLDSEYSGGAHALQILNCENTGTVSSSVADNGYSGLGREIRIGGIIGSSDADSGLCSLVISSCTNRGTVSVNGALTSGKSFRVGGIAGLAWYDSLIDNCKNYGDVTCPFVGSSSAGSAVLNMGGILGYLEFRSSSRYQRITDCVNTGNITTIRNVGNQYLGGILGGGGNKDAYPQISGCKNYGNISTVRTSNSQLGGIAGYTCFVLTNNSNFGNVGGGQYNGAVYGDNNAASSSSGTKVGSGVVVNGVSAPAVGSYSYASGSQTGKDWFVGWNGNAAITVQVVGQEGYTESGSSESGSGGYLFAHTGKGDGKYYRMYYGLSQDGITWTELNGGESPMPTYYGFPYVTQDSEGTFWLIGVSNSTPRHPVIWKSSDMVGWTLVKNIPRSVMALPAGYTNDTNSFGAMKIFYDTVSSQFMITWHAAETGATDDAYWESMRTFYILTSDFETFTPAQKLFAFTGSDANMAQIDATIHYYNNRYYALVKDERTYHSSSSYYKRPRIAVATSLTGPYANPGGALTPKHREGPTMVQSPDKSYWYLYVENYDDESNIYELYRSTSLTASGWSKVTSFTPPSTTNCRHGCVIPIDAKVYRRLQAVYGN